MSNSTNRKPKKVGRPAVIATNQWVQTDKASHEAWARLCMKRPKAAGLLHMLIAKMNEGRDPVVVISQKLLAKILQCSLRTVSRSVQQLEDDNWIESVRLGKGTVSAYRINSRAAWTTSRDDLRWSQFNGTIIADWDDQPEQKDAELRRIPIMTNGEMQLPVGNGEEPPSQPFIHGMEPDLPSVNFDHTDGTTEPEQLERQEVIE